MSPESIQNLRTQKLNPFAGNISDFHDDGGEFRRLPEERRRPFAVPSALESVEAHIEQLEDLIASLNSPFESYDA